MKINVDDVLDVEQLPGLCLNLTEISVSLSFPRAFHVMCNVIKRPNVFTSISMESVRCAG